MNKLQYGKNNPNWKGRLPKCKCGKLLTNYKAKTCKIHKIISKETKLKISIANTGKHHKFSEEHKRNISLAKKGKKSPWSKGCPKGYKHSEETKKKMSLIKLSKNGGFYKKQDKRNDPAYQNWVKQIKKRDRVCQLKNEECAGYLVVHHIKGWTKYPALRYELTNGITLCQAHHPRKRAEEIQMIPRLSVLVGNNV